MKFNYTQASSKDGNRLLLATSSPSMAAGQQSLISMDQFWIRSHLPATTIDKVSWVWMVQFTVCDMLIDSFNDRLAPVVGCSRSDRCYWKGECNIHSLVRWEIAWGWEHTSRNRKETTPQMFNDFYMSSNLKKTQSPNTWSNTWLTLLWPFYRWCGELRTLSYFNMEGHICW